MRVIDNDLLDLFRGEGVCELCGRRVTRREPHHLFGRGFGGARRMDVRIGLISLCGAFSGGMDCHARVHNGKVDRSALLEVVSRREGRSVDSIEREIFALRRL